MEPPEIEPQEPAAVAWALSVMAPVVTRPPVMVTPGTKLVEILRVRVPLARPQAAPEALRISG